MTFQRFTHKNDTPTITSKVSQGQTPLVLEALLLLYGLPLVLTLRKFVELEALAELQNITFLYSYVIKIIFLVSLLYWCLT